MAVDPDQFIVDFPQFAETDTDQIESAIASALTLADTEQWGDLANRAQSLLVAHMLAITAQASATDGRATGNLTGISIPHEVSMQFSNTATAASGGGDGGLKSTVYGQEFLQLRQFKFIPFLIV